MEQRFFKLPQPPRVGCQSGQTLNTFYNSINLYITTYATPLVIGTAISKACWTHTFSTKSTIPIEFHNPKEKISKTQAICPWHLESHVFLFSWYYFIATFIVYVTDPCKLKRNQLNVKSVQYVNCQLCNNMLILSRANWGVIRYHSNYIQQICDIGVIKFLQYLRNRRIFQFTYEYIKIGTL